MISRLSTFAATFAIFATATLSYATSVQNQAVTSAAAAPAAAKQVRIVQLDRVVVTARRSASNAP